MVRYAEDYRRIESVVCFKSTTNFLLFPNLLSICVKCGGNFTGLTTSLVLREVSILRELRFF